MGARQSIRRPDGVKVEYRRMKFDFEDQGFDRYWHGGSPFKSLFWSQMSAAFEPGEAFFIDSARALKGQVKDPELLEEIGEFCKQEGHHTQQHLKFDRINAAMGVDVDRCRARYARLLNRTRDNLDAMDMLAVTAALEHFTASLAERYFADPGMSAGSDPKVAALWAWHAAEEAEHKATCFDIYRELGGSEWRRCTILPAAWFLITAIALVNTFDLLRRDRKLGDLRDVFGGLRYLFGRKGLLTGLMPAFFAYMAPRFHPWRRDNSADVRAWLAANGKYIVGGSRKRTPGAPPASLGSTAAC